MEPISALSAIIGISAAAIELSRKLYEVAHEIKHAREEVESFANEVDMFASAILLAKDSLDRQSEKQDAAAAIRRMKGLRRLIQKVISQSDSINRRIGKTFDQLDTMAITFGFVGRIKWYFRKTDVKLLSNQMNTVQTTMNLVVASVTLELGGTGLSIQEREQLSRRINVCKKGLSASRRQTSQLNQISSELFDDLEDLYDAQTTFIVKCVERVLQKNTPAPTSVRSPRSASSPVNRPKRRRTRSSTTAYVINSQLQQETPFVPIYPSAAINSSLSGSQTIGQSIPPLEASSSLTEMVPESRLLDRSYEEMESVNDNCYEAVEPVSPLVNIHGEGASSISGYIEGANVTVNFNPELETNIISEGEAVRLGLDINYLNEADRKSAQRFSFEDGDIQPIIGWVSFTWSKYPRRHYDCFTVHCAVYARSHPKLVLGKSFAQKRRLYKLN